MNRTHCGSCCAVGILLLGLLLVPLPVAAGEAEIRVGSERDFLPYAFVDQSGQPAGFSVDLIRAVADTMGMRLQFSTGPWNEVWNRLVAGQIDVLPIVAQSPSRQGDVEFCLPHTETFDAFFVRTEQPPIPDLAAAEGKHIVVMQSDAAHHALMERKFSGKLIFVQTIPEGLQLVASGKHDAFLCSKLIGTLELRNHGIRRLSAGPPIPDYQRTFSFAVHKGNTDLTEKLNQGLLIVKTNGEYDRIYRKWLSTGTARETWEESFGRALAILGLLAMLAVGWRLSREAARWDTFLLRILTPQGLWALPVAWRYVLAVVAAAGATALRWALIPWLGISTPYSAALIVAVGITVLLGLRPGLVCMFTGVLASETFVLDSFPPTWDGGALLRMGLKIATGGFVVSILHAARVAVARAHQSEQRLRMQWERMPVGCVVYDENTCLSEMNPAAERIFGYTAAELKGVHANIVIPAAARPHVDGILRRLAEGDMTAHSENANVTKDGRTIVCQWTNTPLRDPAGRFIGFLSMVQDITQRKRAEEELRDSEVKYRRLHDSMMDAFVVVDMAGRIQDCNAAYCQMLGYTEEELLRLTYLDLTPPKWHAMEARIVDEQIVPTGSSGVYEKEYRRKDSWVFPVELRTFLIRDDAGQPRHMWAIVRDITERKRAAMDLERMRTLLSEGQRIAHVGSWEFLAATQETIWSEEQFRIYGLDPTGPSPVYAEMLRKNIHPEDAARLDETFRQCLRDGSIYEQEHRILRPDGSVRVLYELARPHFDDGGQVIKYIGATLDITERKRAEDALAKQARQRALLVEWSARIMAQEAVDDLLALLVDATRELTSARLSLWGYGEGDELRVGRASHAEGVSPDLPVELLKAEAEAIYQVFGEGASLRLSEAEFRAWWSEAALPPSAVPLRGLLAARLVDAAGLPRGLVLASDQEQGGEFTQEDEDLLRQLATVGSLALAHIEARKAAEFASEAKSLFLANMSHELRTPMNAILGMIDVALPKAKDPIVLDCLQTARGSADLLLAILNDLLDSAKIESGKLELEATPFSLQRMLDQLARTLSMRAKEKGLTLSCHRAPQTPDAVIGDRMRLQQILLNLTGNAIKFTERGEVEIRVRALPEAGTLEFAVRDTGTGIPPSKREHIFEPFAQADASTTRQFGGTGLGLSISKQLVEMMGGQIWVESQVDRGSTFYFTARLPVASSLPADFEYPVALRPAPAHRLRILLVEDNPANQKLATYILEERGHRVEVATDGHEALRRTGQNRYDVVLMDVQMPGMDGLQATAAIRRQETGSRRVPIIAMTAHAMRRDRQRCLAAGMDGYLSKPVHAQELIALVESLAVKTGPHGEVPAPPAAAAPPPSQAPVDVFNREEALTQCCGEPEILQEMVDCFHGEMDGLFPQMRAALARGDLAEVGQLGHRMKGTLVYLGAAPARQASLEVERFGKSTGGTQAEAEQAVDALERECRRLKEALRNPPT